MKTFITCLALFSLTSKVCEQPYHNGREYKAENETYLCKYDYNTKVNLHFYQFTNTGNVMKDQPSGVRGVYFIELDSKRKLMELLFEVYGGKEEMQTMGSEFIYLYFYVGMDSEIKELRISFSSKSEKIKTTIFQVETIERLVRERIRFIFDRNHPQFRGAIWLSYSMGYKLSEIPESLENMD